MVFASANILNTYLEFVNLQPERETWDEETLKDNLPSLYRLRMLLSLFQAFELGNLKEFHEGSFVLRKDKKDYNALISEIKFITCYRYVDGRPITLQEISDMFKNLLQYRVEVERVLRFRKDVSKEGGLGLLAHDKIRQTNMELHLEMRMIDSLLSMVISPSDKEVSGHDLIALFNGPEVDLAETNWL